MEKGYFTSYGYRGYVDGRYMLFESDAEYRKYISEQEESKGDDYEFKSSN